MTLAIYSFSCCMSSAQQQKLARVKEFQHILVKVLIVDSTCVLAREASKQNITGRRSQMTGFLVT